MAGAVERLLDGDDVWIMCRLLEELHHYIKTLVRVVDDDILRLNGGEAIAVVVVHAFGEAHLEGRVFQIRVAS
jgi:nucleoside-diphosphate-sugar epimerase